MSMLFWIKNYGRVRIFIIVSIFFLLDSEHWASCKAEKMQCTYCLGIFNNKSITKHEADCGNYQELIENDKKCGDCKKTFESRNDGHKHMRHRAS